MTISLAFAMALKLEFCNVIVPVSKIREKLGDARFEKEFAAITMVTWQDGHLFRESCMNEYDLRDMLDAWENAGIELLEFVDGEKQWKDLCVVNSGHVPSYPCEWIEYDAEKNIAWLKGYEPGALAGPLGRKVVGEQ